jgi:callose synthase
VGKGRDVGMQQIYKFEAKLASGNAEQCLSRDVYRLAQRLDLTRSFSFYYSGPGFYFNNAATVFAMFFFMYLQLLSHLLQVCKACRPTRSGAL